MSKRQPHKRTYNLRRIKATWPYTPTEAAKVLGIHKNLIGQWIKQGLPVNKDQRPYLVRGNDLIHFLGTRQRGRRRQCASDEFYCFKCRAPRKAYENIVDIEFTGPTRFRLKGICAVCNTPLNKMQGVGKLPEIEKAFHVQQVAGRHISGCAFPNLNRDKEPTK